MRRLMGTISFILVVVLLTSCQNTQKPTNAVTKEVVSFQLAQTFFALQPWKADNSQIKTFKGKLTVNNEPVSNAEIAYGNRTLKTNKKGVVLFTLDQSNLSQTSIKVKSVDHASIKGKSINKPSKKALLAISKEIDVGYPIEINKVTPLPESKQVKLDGRLVVSDNKALPVFTVNQYAIYGTITDHDGEPVKNAVVQINREGGEGFAFSKPSDSKGNYILYYTPEDDEELNFKVKVRETTYRLPKNKVYYFPEGMSIETNVQLPKDGNVLVDHSPYLVSKGAPGATYKGVLVGLNVNPNVSYTVTIPKENGSFSMTVPKAVWDQKPPFFETIGNEFLKTPIQPGTEVQSSFLPIPNSHDPDQIGYIKK